MKLPTLLFVTLVFAPLVHAGSGPLPSLNGVEFPAGYQNRPVIALSHCEDNKTLRVILGNPTAIKATHQKIANEISSAREVVSRQLKELENKGLLKLSRGSVSIISEDGLKKELSRFM